MDKPTLHKNGFSLIELLVVIAIISVLAGLLMPALEDALGSARLIECQAQLRGMYAGMMMYADDYKGWGHPEIQWSTNLYILETGYMQEYFDDPAGLFWCPATSTKAEHKDRISMFSYCAMFGTSNWISATNWQAKWFGAWSIWRALTPNINHSGHNVSKEGYTVKVQPPSKAPAYHDAGRADTWRWDERTSGTAGAKDIPANHETIYKKNIIYMDGHTASYDYAELENVCAGYQMHVTMPFGWVQNEYIGP